MKSFYNTSLKLVLKSEGGYVNHPGDPGGATNKGVTQQTYDSYRVRLGKTVQTVKEIKYEEVTEIYYTYWIGVNGDCLPNGLDYCVFDMSINSGSARAARMLQQVVGVEQDGFIGEQTIAAVTSQKTKDIISRFCEARLRWMRTLRTWKIFGKGWTTRVDQHVKLNAYKLLTNTSITHDKTFEREVQGQANEQDKKLSQKVKEELNFPTAVKILSGGGFVTALQGTVAIQVIAVLAACVGFLWVWKRYIK